LSRHLSPSLWLITFCPAQGLREDAYGPGVDQSPTALERTDVLACALVQSADHHRRLDPRTARGLWRSQRWRFCIAGLLMTALFTIPVVNLVASLIAAAFMVHLVITLSDPAAPPAL
jgi:hypothetical protein